MALDSVTLPSVWDIPTAVGVPALLGQSIGAGVDASASTALAGVYEQWMVKQQAKTWGIFDSTNTQILTAAHVIGVNYSNGYDVSDAPLEDGAFTSYNKVKRPYSAMITMVCDGTEYGKSSVISSLETLVGLSNSSSSSVSIRASFLKTLETIVGDTNFYSIVTPEYTFVNANIVRYSFRRTVQNGVTMIMCDIEIQEIRKTAYLVYTSTKEAEGEAATQNGTVQTTTPSTATSDAVAGVLA